MNNDEFFKQDVERILHPIIKALAIVFLAIALISGLGLALYVHAADPEVTYCIDLRTNEIKVVAKGMPCPFPTTQM